MYVPVCTFFVKEKSMNRQVSKPNIFWSPSLDTARKIDDGDTVNAIETARYRFTASMADLEAEDESAMRGSSAIREWKIGPMFERRD
jgi:hypothetical protein